MDPQASTDKNTSRTIHGELLEFNDAVHAYKWAGKFVPGVTTILRCISKPALINWAAGCASDHWLKEITAGNKDLASIHKAAKSSHTKKTEAAGDIGKNVHHYAECFFKKRDLPELLTDQAKRGAEAFHSWIDAHHVKIKASELLVFSKEHYYAGTCDFIAEIDGILGVGDIKTGSGIYPDMRFQVAGYQHALQEEKGIKFPVRWIVRFDKPTGNFEVKTYYDFDLDFFGFKAALDLHRTLQAMNEKKSK